MAETPADTSASAMDGPATTTPPRVKPLRRLQQALRSAIGSRVLSLCWVTYFLAIVWVFLHPVATVSTGELKCRGTYMSENALLVSSMAAQVSIQTAHRVKARQTALMQAREPMMTSAMTRAATIEQELRAIDRVEVARQRFQDRDGAWRTNVYGILRAAPLGDHKESIALVVHAPTADALVQQPEGDVSALALGIELLTFLSAAQWLAKDIILLIPDDGPTYALDGVAPGTDAWLHAYHSDPVVTSAEGSLPIRAGLIRAALHLEITPPANGSSTTATTIALLTAGRNGQLPNLDLVNTAVRHISAQKLGVALDRCTPSVSSAHSVVCGDGDILSRMEKWLLTQPVLVASVPGWGEYVTRLTGMLRFMKTLAMGPNGPHASFIGYNIDALTMAITPTGRASASSASTSGLNVATSLRSVLRALELTIRSLSNIEEKLHQSFFLYILPSPTTFVSVGEYYYPVALAVSPAIVNLLYTASSTAGTRVAFAAVIVLLLQLGGALLLAQAARLSSFIVNLPSTIVVLGSIAVAQVVIITVVVPRLRDTWEALRGNAGARSWQARLAEFHKDQTSEKKEPPSASTTFSLASDSLHRDDNGARALQCAMLTLIVFAHCILGILNYPMALSGALLTAPFALVRPKHSLSTVWANLFALWLLVSSPIVLGIGQLAASSTLSSSSLALTNVTYGFATHTNLLALPYLCLLYVPVHTLAVAVWLSPPIFTAQQPKTHTE